MPRTETPQTSSLAPALTAPAMCAAERLRAFEDQVLGVGVPRIDGRIECGSGSRFSSLPPADRRHHDDLVGLCELEAAMVAAADALAKAQAAHKAQQEVVAASARRELIEEA